MEVTPAPGETPAAPPTATPAAPAAPAEPAAPAQPPEPTSQPSPTGSEPETNPSGGNGPDMVPSSRLREETEKRRQAEEEAAQLREQLESPPPPPTPSGGDDDELDPEVEGLIRKGAKKLGLVSQEELDRRELQAQVRQDVVTLENEYANSGIPYVHNDVLQYAKDNDLPITSKEALRAAYRGLNWDKLLEVERQRAIADSRGGSGAELPGSAGGATPPEEPEVQGKTIKERTTSRIRSARQKLQTG